MRSPWWLLFFVLLAGLGYLGARYLTGAGETKGVLIGSGCDLGQGPCRHALPDGGVLRISFRPRPVPLMQPVEVLLSIEGSRATPRRLDITGLNMRMAPNRVGFESVGRGAWRGETIFPVCSQRQMHWQAALTLQHEQAEVWLVRDHFYTVRQ